MKERDAFDMKRRKVLTNLLAFLPLSSVALANDQDKDKGHGKGKGSKDQDHGDQSDWRYFRPEDYPRVERFYSGPRDLPPGLRKKYYRTGKLPPGWEKKMQPFPPELARQLPPVPPNCERGYIDGVAVIYDRNTRIILDSVDLINAIAGH
jgi:hypothetical protein